MSETRQTVSRYTGPLTAEQRRPDVIAPALDKRAIEITWLDGHRSSYGFDLLRWNCPCAICAGEMGAPGVLASTDQLAPDQVDLVDLGPVGSYAMNLVWRDGHNTGIYSWDFLRRICPCDECRRLRG